jgi:DNA-binding CsgD family transcriptional regulator
MSQEQLAARAKLSERTVRNLEGGRVRSPHHDTVRLLADALELGEPERKSWFAAAGGTNERQAEPAIVEAGRRAPVLWDPPLGRAGGQSGRGPVAMTGRPTLLHGRAAEQSTIGRLIADAREGRGGALVLRGEPGIGKTALLDYAAEAADQREPGMTAVRVVRGAGVKSEAELPFASLHMLLGPALDRVPALSPPQQKALRGAFGQGPASPADRFLVGLAVLSLLTGLAEDGPLLCLVDDAHWLDQASADALVFASRRLRAEGIAVVFAARDHDAPFPASGLPDLRLAGLDSASASSLLMEHGGTALPPEVRRLILAEASGNPLGLIELPAACLGSCAAIILPGRSALPLSGRLQRAFHDQVRRLPGPTQALLLVAAAERSGDLSVVLIAGDALAATAADLEPAEQAHLVNVQDGTVTFRHPLVRAAVYNGATLAQRVAAHRAVADALRDTADAGRRAWHLAAAATGPDEDTAAELERAAAKARARGGYAAAAAARERAVQLTANPAALAGRLTLAAEAAAEVGDFDRTRALAARAASQTADSITRARLAHVHALADSGQGKLRSAHRLLVGGAELIGDLDPPRATRMLMHAMHIAWFLGDTALRDTADRLEAAGRAVPEPLRPLVRLMLCPAAQAAGQPSEDLDRLAELVAQARSARAEDPVDLTLVALASLVTGLNSDARDLLAALVADARAQGRLGCLPAVLTCLAQVLVFEGWLREALTTASEALRIAQNTGQHQWTGEASGISAYLAAIYGQEERCRRLLDATLNEPASHVITTWAHWALGLLDLARGRPVDALSQFETITRGPVRYHASALRSIPDLVEAAVRLGQPQRADAPLRRFAEWAQHARARSTDALVERCRALLALDEDAEQHYLAALDLHEPSFEQARTQLLYGSWLRRTRRKTQAGTQLRAAADYLERAAARYWAQRARAELETLAVAAPPPGQPSLPHLTPQELQIARLAAQGRSNREIAALLFLSPRTVGYHLYKAYPKLGITSRLELDLDTLRR